ncbi:MAG: flagellar hook-basal body complex protein FliE [Defluviitaleaceae bacterium]|nr:flagellar hook-basal body complex protein FliE [Defluviitaleaceae bacterium]MCL2835872.1 flagellar hook-basal body complex protein FliE [Defluviitaleaceae bacterium]
MEITGVQGLNPLWRIGDIGQIGQIPGLGTEIAASRPEKSFDAFLRAMLDNVNETNEAIMTSQQFQLDVAQGYSDDLIGLSLAIEKANASLNFTVQVTNRLLEAYREIMRMQM